MSTPTLLTIPWSHFCEKARWALSRRGVPFRERGHMPMLSRLAGLSRGVWHSVPVLFTETGPVRGSGAIVRFADAHGQTGAPLHGEGAMGEEIEALEALFDKKLGPETRRFVYHSILARPEVAHALAAGAPRAERWIARRVFRAVEAMMRRSMNIDASTAETSRQRIDAIFEEVGTRMAEGRSFLIGDRFTAADLAFAALAAPILLPPQHPSTELRIDAYPEPLRADCQRYREHPAGQFALRLYATERA